jgi:hypothetical protein
MSDACNVRGSLGAGLVVRGRRLLAIGVATGVLCLSSYASAQALTVYEDKAKFGLKDATGAVVTIRSPGAAGGRNVCGSPENLRQVYIRTA